MSCIQEAAIAGHESIKLALGSAWAVDQLHLPMQGNRSGDFVISRRRGDLLQIFVGDAAGHGADAEMLASELRELIERDATVPVTAALFAAWNEELEPHFACKFVCLTYIEIDSNEKVARIANCGNPETLIVRANGEVIQCGATGMPIGMIEPATWHAPEMTEVSVGADDAIISVTDGVTEQAGPGKQRFGIEGVLSAVAKAAVGSAVSFLNECLTRFAGEMPREDDVTMLCIGPAAKQVA